MFLDNQPLPTFLLAKRKKNLLYYWQLKPIEKENQIVHLVRYTWRKDTSSDSNPYRHSLCYRSYKPIVVSRSDALPLMIDLLLEIKKKGYRHHLRFSDRYTKDFMYPMLPSDWNTHWHLLKDTPLCIYPYVNGVKSLYQQHKGFYNHQGKTFEHLSNLQLPVSPKWIVDGEFILPPPYSFSDTVKTILGEKKKLIPLLEFVVYDCLDLDKVGALYSDRKKWIVDSSLTFLPSTLCQVQHQSDLDSLYQQALADGYEGLSIKALENVYEPQNTSYYYQLKLNHRLDEYLIVNYKAQIISTKKEKLPLIVFVCQTSKGDLFDVRMIGTNQKRAAMYQSAQQYLGHWLTVRYDYLGIDLIPVGPLGVSVR